MKQSLLFTLALAAGTSCFAQQRPVNPTPQEKPVEFRSAITGLAAKTSAVNDTFAVRNYSTQDTMALYVPDMAAPYDSGMVSGTNAWGDKAFAERFDISGADSSVEVLGAVAYFVGSANVNSTKTIKIKAWAQGPYENIAPKVFFSGFPGAVLDSVTINMKDLREADGTIDTVGIWWFANPTSPIADSFFMGYSIDYDWANLNGDTIALVQTRHGNRHTPLAWIASSTNDTILNVQNATMMSNGSWIDNFQENTPGLANHYVIHAIFRVHNITGVANITKNNLTFTGSFPNPANTISNIKLSLKNATDVVVDVVDMTGRKIKTVNAENLRAGEHTIPVNVSDMAAGNYVFMIRTAEGDGMGVQFTVVR